MKFIEEELNLFMTTALERYKIYLRKSRGDAKPWTTDTIFRNWRFCNVYRRLDKVSDYIIKKVIEPNEDKPNLYTAIIICRFFSRIETIEYLINKNYLFAKPEQYKEVVENLIELNNTQPIMTNAFILNPLQINGVYYHKAYTPFVINKKLLELNFENLLLNNKYIQWIVSSLIKLPSTAGFMAYEYATDLTYSKRYFTYPAKDRLTYGNFTVGSLRGLRRLCGLGVEDNRLSRSDTLQIKELTIQLLETWNNYRSIHFSGMPSFEMREVEHWLCEYDKYSRIYKGETTRLKQTYKG